MESNKSQNTFDSSNRHKKKKNTSVKQLKLTVINSWLVKEYHILLCIKIFRYLKDRDLRVENVNMILRALSEWTTGDYMGECMTQLHTFHEHENDKWSTTNGPRQMAHDGWSATDGPGRAQTTQMTHRCRSSRIQLPHHEETLRRYIGTTWWNKGCN